jgi:Zinc finger, C2H2 type
MTPRVAEPSSKRAARPRIDSEIATAQILAEFQYNESQRPFVTACSDNCPSPPAQSCVEECEIPCTANCTDQCVVVCEEPHDLNEDLCCDLQNACDNSDCQYADLDESCCMGCPSDPQSFPLTHCDDIYDGNRFDMGQLWHYQQSHLVNNHLQMHHSSSLHQAHFIAGQQDFRPACFSGLGFSHCTLPCSLNSTITYEGSPIPSLVPSAGESPWSLQSSLSGPSAPQYSPGAEIESENPLNVLADYSTTDFSFLNTSNTFTRPPKFSVGHNNTQNLPEAPIVDLTLGDSALSQPKLGGAVSEFWLSSGAGVFPKTEEDADVKDAFGLSCRWLVNDVDDSKLCDCVFKSREELHRHIVEDHVKAIKKRGVPTTLLVPVCRWHGCESARKKKAFKLQHLKDHIVCHSKLRMRCEICGKECRDAKVLKLHMNTHRPGQEKPFRCDVEGCTASFGTSALLSSHKRVHTGEKPHKCAWCNYRAADKGNLRRHEEEMHMGKKWPCPYCSQQLAKKANLTRHISM